MHTYPPRCLTLKNCFMGIRDVHPNIPEFLNIFSRIFFNTCFLPKKQQQQQRPSKNDISTSCLTHCLFRNEGFEADLSIL